MDLAAPLPIGVVFLAVIVAAITDLCSFKIYNVLTLPLLASGLIYHGITGGMQGFVLSLLGAVVGIGLLLLFFLMGGMGGGDVKLMAGIGAWLGAPGALIVLAIASITAGAYALILAVVYGRFRDTWLNLRILWHRIALVGRHLAADDAVETELKRPEHQGRVIPFGAMVAVGVFAVVIRLIVQARS